MRLTVVGCSGSVPGPGSPASCYLVEAEDDAGRTWRVVLDLGSGAYGPLQRHVEPTGLDAVLLSHLHADHCLDATALYVALKYGPAGRRDTPPVAVWAPSGAPRRLARAYDLTDERPLARVLAFSAWRQHDPVRIGPLTVVPHRMNHPVETYGLRVTGPAEQGQGGGERVLAYTGDTDTCPALLELGRDADLLLSEASLLEEWDEPRDLHLTGRRAGRAGAEAGARRLVLTHLPPWTPPGAVQAEARAEYPGPLELAAPGAVLVV
ncbi:MBL fold metallo-hydrolase [Quadrisphaera sp. DSM 44207]|uniref:MBL fold metallo-hydrolase n=1 Tax=Quadrisphaera sp. DSM 44207 TaxID=1881057 RepID=UPI000880E17E|nr:MBL fold metallo-hydrolase [Quadrisphaera sp. DSM 44207]SDQ07454.1 Ribonuclease BN, tRNA processing enzyme [Quadrisphaera sp. DSM 44207]